MDLEIFLPIMGGLSDDEELFKAAAKHYASHNAPFSYVAKLQLYGLYKQATEGDLNASSSAGWAASAWGWIKSASSLSPREEAKRRSWLRCRGMSRGRAMTMYVGKVLARCAQRELDFKLDGEPEEADATADA